MKKYLSGTKNAAITGLKNLLYTFSKLKKINVPIFIHFGLRKNFNIHELVNFEPPFESTLHIDEDTISRIPIDKDDKKSELIPEINKALYHQKMEMPELGISLLTTENYLQNIAEGCNEMLSFIFMPGSKTHYVLLTEVLKNESDISFRLKNFVSKLEFKEIEQFIDQLDQDYERITWARMRDKTANLVLTAKKIEESYLEYV